jgi:hypothetical protein
VKDISLTGSRLLLFTTCTLKTEKEQRNVITIPPALHKELRVHLVVNRPDLTIGDAGEEAVKMWLNKENEPCKRKHSRKASATSR